MTTNKPGAHGVTHPLPPLGSFLRPIGARSFGYTMQVTRHYIEADEPSAIEYARWGIRDGLPCDDGHIKPGRIIELEQTAIPGVWRWPWRWPEARNDDTQSYRWAQPSRIDGVVYYRIIDCDDRGQMRLI